MADPLQESVRAGGDFTSRDLTNLHGQPDVDRKAIETTVVMVGLAKR
jgi:hypothetical protein